MKRRTPYLPSKAESAAKKRKLNLAAPRQMRAWRAGPAIQYRPAPVYGRAASTELKAVDSTVDLPAGSVLATLNTNAGIAVMNAVQPGTGSWNRIGKKIRMKSLRYKFLAVGASVNVAELLQNSMRVTLVYDKQSSSAAVPTYDTIFGSTTQSGVEGTTSFLDNQRIDNTARFIVLKDDVFTSEVNSVVAAGTAEWQCNVDIFVKLRGLETIFSGQSNPCTIADISSGALYLIFRAELNNGFTSFRVANSSCRLRYYD